MKKKSFIFLLFLNSIIAYSCTTFVLKNEKSLVFGRNLDWVSDDGVIVVNKRNIQKASLVFPPEQSTYWTSKYGSVTFNQFGKELPFGGINEMGLVVEIMRVAGDYPDFDTRTAVNELQWIQYQLDNAATIADVLASDDKIRISKIDQNLHFLICDQSGNTAVIEFNKNGMQVYQGTDLPIAVLENDPYIKSLKKHEYGVNCRFKTASDMIEQYSDTTNEDAIDYSFSILDKVALDGSWSIVYDINNREIHFKTASDKTLRRIQVNNFNFSCNESSLLYDLKRKDSGVVNAYFGVYTAQLNNAKLDAGIKSNQVPLPQSILRQFYRYNATCYCVKK